MTVSQMEKMMRYEVSRYEHQAKVFLNGRFDYSCHRELRRAFDDACTSEGTLEVVIDMQGVDYMDSSALGMLSLLRDRCRASNQKLSLANCRTQVMQILKVTNFDKLFTVQ